MVKKGDPAVVETPRREIKNALLRFGGGCLKSKPLKESAAEWINHKDLVPIFQELASLNNPTQLNIINNVDMVSQGPALLEFLAYYSCKGISYYQRAR